MYGDGLRLKYPRLYRFWAKIKNLCTNKNHKMYCNYGGIGIELYEEWYKYENFMNWAVQNGWDETKHIYRYTIYDNFSPQRCYITNDKLYIKPIKCLKHRVQKPKKEVNKEKLHLYHVWHSMKTRCYNKNHKAYYRYGGRGIIVCDEWKNSFKAFQKWAQQSGYKIELSIDRINNDGNYEPSNCRWATQEEQMNNMSRNKLFEYKGQIYTLMQLSKEFNKPYSLLHGRLCIYPYWSVEDALNK